MYKPPKPVVAQTPPTYPKPESPEAEVFQIAASLVDGERNRCLGNRRGLNRFRHF